MNLVQHYMLRVALEEPSEFQVSLSLSRFTYLCDSLCRFYMSCFQLNVGGSGSASPSTVRLPGAYSANDPGILINIYQNLNAYTGECKCHTRDLLRY